MLMGKECGADCVKFQKSCLSAKFTQAALETPYESQHSFGRTYGEHKLQLEFNESQYIELQRWAQRQGVMFTASAMDEVMNSILVGRMRRSMYAYD